MFRKREPGVLITYLLRSSSVLPGENRHFKLSMTVEQRPLLDRRKQIISKGMKKKRMKLNYLMEINHFHLKLYFTYPILFFFLLERFISLLKLIDMICILTKKLCIKKKCK